MNEDNTVYVDISRSFDLLVEEWTKNFTDRLRASIGPDLGATDIRVLTRLSPDDPLGPSELSARIGVGLPAISKSLSRLRGKGLVVTERDPADGRALLVLLTEDGSAQADALHRIGSGMTRGVVRDWSDEDVRTLSGLLERYLDDTRRFIAETSEE
ncbi:MarR family winged helix-turn-helix transcriptional regulator [Brevibacterium litoralis]|uniref:MarR family winged helix-turn-helix transcriptional regulator n=1 Tax=Brevibacterium litoralis TaxID=3138935 RepID=UPI0032EC4598